MAKPGSGSAAKIITALTAHGQFAYDQKGRGWWLPWREFDDPYAKPHDEWIAPIQIASASFNQFASKIATSPVVGKAAKEIQEACLGEAYKGLPIHAVDWSSYDHEHRTLRIAISESHVVCVSSEGYSVERNGAGMVYVLPYNFEPLHLDTLLAYMQPGSETMPNLHACLLDELPPAALTSWHRENGAWTTEEQAAVVKAWWLGTFLEPAIPGRPILSFIGQKGSGKSVSARQLGILFYGKNYEVSGGVGGSRAVKDLIATIVNVPVTVADDLNDVPADIVDTLCKISTGASIQLATMHETLALSTYKARSSIALTSNRPMWALRDDLMDRMLPLVLDSVKPATNMTEVARCHRSSRYRTAVWGETLYCLYFALANSNIWDRKVRFEEWETMVRRIADRGGWHGVLHTALCKAKAQRVAVACWADSFVAALYKVADSSRDNPKLYSASELYDAVTMRMGGTVSAVATDRPSARAIASPAALGKFLGTINRSGSTVVDIMRGPDIGGSATWTIRPKDMED